VTQQNPDPQNSLLRSKRIVSLFQILAEIAEHQPAIRQQEIADKIGLTPQAVSEYIRELSGEGMVTVNSRGNYEVTRAGIEWMLANAEDLESYARHIRRDIIHQVLVWTAIAAEDLKTGEVAGIYMSNGFLYASKKSREANGTVVSDAKKDEEVGITHLNGLINHREGIIHVCKVPRIQQGGSRRVKADRLMEVIGSAGLVAAVGIEASVALKAAGKIPDLFFGSREGVIEAAFHGIDCAIVIVEGEFTDFLKRLEGVGLSYNIIDLISL